MDIGSNGIRFLWGRPGHVQGKRIALRLGRDSFRQGKISKELACRLKETVFKFSQLVEAQGIGLYRVIGTSALREALNGPEVVRLIKKKTKINIEIIDAEEEARLIQMAVSQCVSLKNKKSLLVDIGGGSAEYVLLNNEKQVRFFTKALGTVRVLEDIQKAGKEVTRKNIEELVDSRLNALKDCKSFFDVSERSKVFVATGGNPRALGRLAEHLELEPDSSSVSLESLLALVEVLSSLSYEQRMKKLGLGTDRADVVLPAAIVLLRSMEHLNFEKLRLPSAGLKDGLILDMFRQRRRGRSI